MWVAARAGRRIPLHVCIDTGIGRVGVPFRGAAPLIRDLASRKSVEIAGTMMTFTEDEKFDVELHPHDPTTAERQIARLNRVRKERDNAKVQQLLDQLVRVARDESANIMPVTIELVRAGASMGDIIEKLKTIWGTYRENPVF